MSQLPFVENYFSAKSRIIEAHREIESLAFLSDTSFDDSEDYRATAAPLKRPVLFAVSGETNSGKSSFLNTLLGHEICAVSALPCTREIQLHAHKSAQIDFPNITQRLHEIASISDIQAIDTPGANLRIADDALVLQRINSKAELIFHIFHTSNPWAASTWSIISKLSPEAQERSVLIITHSDKCLPADLTVIHEHMEELIRQKLNHSIPIFILSSIHPETFSFLRAHISKKTLGAPLRLQPLHDLCRFGFDRLEKIELQLDTQSHNLSSQGNFLTTLEKEIDDMREDYVKRLPSHLEDVTLIFVQEADDVSRKLSSQLRLFKSIFRVFMGDFTSAAIEALFIGRLRKAVEKVGQNDAQEIVAACNAHWLELEERVSQTIGKKGRDQSDVTARLNNARQYFINHISAASGQAIENLKIRRGLENHLSRRNTALKAFVASILTFLAFAAALGIYGQIIFPMIFLALASSFAVAGIYVAYATRARAVRHFRQTVKSTCGIFAEAIRTDYEEALRVFFDEYKVSLSSIRRYLADEKLSVSPRLSRLRDLQLIVKSIEQDIR